MICSEAYSTYVPICLENHKGRSQGQHTKEKFGEKEEYGIRYRTKEKKKIWGNMKETQEKIKYKSTYKRLEG
jgi:hypothetical protein